MDGIVTRAAVYILLFFTLVLAGLVIYDILRCLVIGIWQGMELLERNWMYRERRRKS